MKPTLIRLRARTIFRLIPFLLAGACSVASFSCYAVPALSGRQSLLKWVQNLCRLRHEAMLKGSTAALKPYYAGSHRGQLALGHEERRLSVLTLWLMLHRARLVKAEANLRIIHPERTSAHEITVYLTVSTALIYAYEGKKPPARTETMAYTTYHRMTVRQTAGHWLVDDEWYEDPLCAQMPYGEEKPADLIIPDLLKALRPPISSTRQAALAYADRFCGVVVTAVADGRYNRRYPDFTFDGGDCANFASQVLSDAAAGRLERDWSWWCDRRHATVAWARAEDLVSHLLATGRAALLCRGTLAELIAGDLLANLLPGDLIAYQRRGAIRHVAVVTGRDGRGWPLINCHTADRYHNPFDLGWSIKTQYWLLKTGLD